MSASASPVGQREVGVELDERLEREAPLVQARVRDGEVRLVDRLVAVEQQVEIDRPRAETLAGVAHAAELVARPRAGRSSSSRGSELGLDRDGAVQEARLVDVAHGLGLAQRRHGEDADVRVGAQELDARARSSRRRSPRFDAEADVGAHERRSVKVLSLPRCGPRSREYHESTRLGRPRPFHRAYPRLPGLGCSGPSGSSSPRSCAPESAPRERRPRSRSSRSFRGSSPETTGSPRRSRPGGSPRPSTRSSGCARSPSRSAPACMFGEVETPERCEATIMLRDLVARLDRLSYSERAVARRLLARPTSAFDSIRKYRAKARNKCGPQICVFWVEKTSDAPSLKDGNRNRVPDWIDLTREVDGYVWSVEVGRMGYRAPQSDRKSKNHGPNGKLDVYVADVGAIGLYGYCTTDDPSRGPRGDISAYCVVDDDFARSQFSGAAYGVRALQRDRRARVLPRRPVRLRLARGPLAHGRHRRLDRGRGLRHGQRQPPVPEGRPAGHGLRLAPARPREPRLLRDRLGLPLRRLDLLALPVASGSARASSARSGAAWTPGPARSTSTRPREPCACSRTRARTSANLLADFGYRNLRPGAFYAEGSKYPKPGPIVVDAGARTPASR